MVWKKIEEILEQEFTPEKCAGYMFGSESLGIPENAGYYYAIRIVTDFLKKHPELSFQQLLNVNPNEIFNEARFIFSN